MKIPRTIVLSGVIAILLIAMVNLDVAVADEEPVGGGPGDDLQVYMLKKSFDFCNDGITCYDDDVDVPGGSVPDGMDVQTAGCADRWANNEQLRMDNYAFTGEQIAFLVVARDLDGAIAMSHAILQVDDYDVAYCNDVTAAKIACMQGDCKDPFYRTDKTGRSVLWKGHVVYPGILGEYPPQKSESTSAGFDPMYDKIYECFLTVTDDMDGPSDVTVTVYDTVNDLEAVTDPEMFFFNPEVSLDISVSSGSAIEFEDGYAGDLVYSVNRLMLENAAEGGVDIAVWLGGTDLTSPDMAAKCPYSNILDVEGIDGWLGMQFRCELDNGLYTEQTWQQVENKIIKESCWNVNDGYSTPELCLGLNPLFLYHENVLENGHEAECVFKLQYPVPCIGEFTSGNLIIIMRAI